MRLNDILLIKQRIDKRKALNNQIIFYFGP
jgi:hypothetical protein